MVEERTKALSEANKELLEKSRQIELQNNELELNKTNLEKQVQIRTKDLEEAKEKAEESDKLKSAFLANMSHEIRTPLNAIMGFTSLITTEHFKKTELEGINAIIQNNGHSLMQLINDIIDLSMIESKQMEIIHKPFAINPFKEGIHESFKNEMSVLNNKNLRLILDINQEFNELNVVSDIGRIKQIFSNLFSNAIKFTTQGYIKYGYQIDINQSEITFFMEDTGIGISEANLKTLFTSFHKIEVSNAVLHRGTGLGLSISKHLAGLLGGKMWVVSTHGEGTTFYFSIPLVLAHELANPKAIVKLKDIEQFNWKSKSVLIAEDEDTNFKLIETILKKTKINIVHVRNGKEACEMIQNDPKQFDLILMDIKMPVMSGTDATIEIKKNTKTPVIAQTAFATQHEINTFMKAGFDDYIIKPIIASEMFHKMSKYLS